jgi:hypothetical protein
MASLHTRCARRRRCLAGRARTSSPLRRLLSRTDLPGMVIDDGERHVCGAGGPRIAGSANALAAWLSGRSDGRDLDVVGGAPPVVPPWC